ncbi:ribose ABC superfamily ATP binding cassette transporter, binding protein [Paenibacillus mucilaginosus 3016]|uniref:Ribose ABC superfamily ATP binding cassette transporter, binding protein n=2 Tax=Paenibacillus mucilaginosus TaxID=61624 RepID=H6NJB0_9BACL|nr:ABC transporter substrate-binding protein [Paenibacillus mucilaginosus]AFC29189.1 ribose ABC superfamily ATP binding cassette transporter, binding protein [Paenibacillus mucilaginosus 3016]AFH61362.1 ribose ABC transporter ATP-binding protein [Paenibacillus mucilaginosus K02]WFA17923.1 ribose ABC transporter ATP-binding protein [Paenibacillus mucilaginosus]
MKRTVKPSFMILSLLMFIILSACATGANTQNTSAGSTDAAKKVRIGLTVPTLSNPFFVAMSKGAQEAASKFNAEVITVSADQDLAKQTAQIEDFITKKVDLILLSPFDSKGIAAAVAQAKAANIPVIAVDGFAEGGINTVVMSDNVMAGTLAGEYLAKRLNGKGQIVIMDGPPVSAVTDRIKGFEEVMKKYPEIKVISKQNGEGNREKALSVMENILQANKKIDAVFAINDPEGVGIKIAAEQAGRGGEFFIVGVDGAPDAVTALKEKKAFAATSAQFPNEMVVKAVELGLQIKEGKSIDSKVLIPVELITQENVEQYRGW